MSEIQNDSDEDIGPKIEEANFGDEKDEHILECDEPKLTKPIKDKNLQFEKLFIDALPNSNCYELSYMHRDIVTHVNIAKTGFLVTASLDGHVKFWKKAETGIEFIKHFKAHIGGILDSSMSSDGSLYATISEDQALKIFDVINFDMINIIKLDFIPITCEWICNPQDALKAISLSHSWKPFIYIFDAYTDGSPLYVYQNLHRTPIINISFNYIYEIAISIDTSGMMEYWTGPTQDYRNPLENPDKFRLCFHHKTDTDLYDLARLYDKLNNSESKIITPALSSELISENIPMPAQEKAKKILRTLVISAKLGFSPNGQYFAFFCFNDDKVRLYKFDTGRLFRVYEENKQTLNNNIFKANNLVIQKNKNKAQVKQQKMMKRIIKKRKQMDFTSSVPDKNGDKGGNSSEEASLSSDTDFEEYTDQGTQASSYVKIPAKKRGSGQNVSTSQRPLLTVIEFNRRLALERDLILPYIEATPNDNDNTLDFESQMFPKTNNVTFDASGKFIIYATILGIRIMNIVTNKCMRLLGIADDARFLNLALFQGKATINRYLENTVPEAISMEIEVMSEIVKPIAPDPIIFATAYKKSRFYMYSTREPKEDMARGIERDIFNEKPTKDDMLAVPNTAISVDEKGAKDSSLGSAATIHTRFGDIHVKLFPENCPKTIQNFCVHSRNGYYNGHLFHRIIKGFMIQTGDPTGTGTGGESIWGGDFEDEITPAIKHDKPYTLSMANAGPNTNGSQFFITVIPCPWLDGKHTIFGIVNKGMSVVNKINNVKTDEETDKPLEDINILSITIK